MMQKSAIAGILFSGSPRVRDHAL